MQEYCHDYHYWHGTEDNVPLVLLLASNYSMEVERHEDLDGEGLGAEKKQGNKIGGHVKRGRSQLGRREAMLRCRPLSIPFFDKNTLHFPLIIIIIIIFYHIK